MSKVYLVTDGDYSDYRVLGVFSTLDLANEAKATLCANNPVDERELDTYPSDETRFSKIAWIIKFDSAGNIPDWRTIAYLKLVDSGWLRAAKRWLDGIEVLARGDSLDDAVKSATDTRRMWLAMQEKPEKPSILGFVEVK